jgi:cytochrome c551/c552
MFLGAFVAAQGVRFPRTNPPVESDVAAPPAVEAILHRACYDCHSHETVWPWYSNVAPVSWLVIHDVDEARHHVDFSTWGTLSEQKRLKKLDDIVEMVQEGDMPLWYYVLMHPRARLTDEDVATLRQWAVDQGVQLDDDGGQKHEHDHDDDD